MRRCIPRACWRVGPGTGRVLAKGTGERRIYHPCYTLQRATGAGGGVLVLVWCEVNRLGAGVVYPGRYWRGTREVLAGPGVLGGTGAEWCWVMLACDEAHQGKKRRSWVLGRDAGVVTLTRRTVT
jgi:hypothetical protein